MQVDLEPRRGHNTIEEVVGEIERSLSLGYCSVAVTSIGQPMMFHMEPTMEGERMEARGVLAAYAIDHGTAGLAKFLREELEKIEDKP